MGKFEWKPLTEFGINIYTRCISGDSKAVVMFPILLEAPHMVIDSQIQVKVFDLTASLYFSCPNCVTQLFQTYHGK